MDIEKVKTGVICGGLVLTLASSGCGLLRGVRLEEEMSVPEEEQTSIDLAKDAFATLE